MATNPVSRLSRNGINVCFNDAATNTSVVCYNQGYTITIGQIDHALRYKKKFIEKMFYIQ